MQSIVISDPRPDWAADYRAIANHLRGLFNPRPVSGTTPTSPGVVRIDHIGSTAVTGLAAKDVIDVQITVCELADQTVIERLTQAGYQRRDDIRFDNLVGLASDDPALAKHYLTQPPDRRAAHIHVREQGRLNQIYPLLFRDYLRAEPTTRAAYAKVKRALAARFADDPSAYYAIKDPYMDTVYQAACLWRDAVGWQVDQRYI